MPTASDRMPTIWDPPISVVSGGDLTLIATIAGAQAAYDFTAIAGTHRSLLLSFQGRSDVAATEEALLVELNGDSVAANYNTRGLQKTTYINTANQRIANVVGATGTAALSSHFTMWLHKYADGSSFHRIVELTGSEWPTAAGQDPRNMSLKWGSGAAVVRVRLLPLTGSFTAASGATLWGLG